MTLSKDTDVQAFVAARDRLLALREDADAAMSQFRWPTVDEFNWALDFFDTLPRDQTALWLVNADGSDDRCTFGELSDRSNRVANFLRTLGVARGDRILLVLGNSVPLWETMLAAMKLGAVVIPATTLLTADDLYDRIDRGQVAGGRGRGRSRGSVRGPPRRRIRIAVGDAPPAGTATPSGPGRGRLRARRPDAGQRSSAALLHVRHDGATEARRAHPRQLPGRTPVDDVLARPATRRRAHQHLVARVGQACLELLFRARGTRRNRRHLQSPALRSIGLLDMLMRCEVTTFCAPPTVWRMLIQPDLTSYKTKLREVVAAGEPLNPEVIEQVRARLGPHHP